MPNHTRLNIARLSWLVILLTIGILAVGSITKTSADSPVVVGLTDFSGQIGIAPEAILFDPVIAPFSVHPVELAETSNDQTNIQLVIFPPDPGGSLPETTSLPTDAHPDQMIVVLPTTSTPLPSGEVDVTSHPAPDPEPVAAPEISIETVEIFQPGPPSQDLGEEGSIPVQVVEFNFGTVDQVLPSEQDPPDVVVVELEPVDELQGDVPQIDPSHGLAPEPEQPAVNDPADIGGDTPTEPFSTEPGFVPSAATSDGPTGDANPATAPHTESLNLGNCECQDLTAWLGHLGDPKNMVYPAVTVAPDGQRQLVTVKIPYEWDLDCGSSARDYVGKCEETLSFSVDSDWSREVVGFLDWC